MIDQLCMEKITLEEQMFYNKAMVLSYRIEYPQFCSPQYNVAAARISRCCKSRALAFQRYCRQCLYQQAVRQYEDSIANNDPLRPLEAVLTCEVPLNEKCACSLFFDKYQYTGGAHGNTIRCADCWNIQNGQCVMLRDLFDPGICYRDYVIACILGQIRQQIAACNNVYFDNYEENVKKYFNECQFYLTEEGIVCFFQQYDIAPYSSGMPEFLIPYSNEGVNGPRCKRCR